MTDQDVSELLAAHGQPGYRANQLLEWVYKHGVGRFDEMSNLPQAIRTLLSQHAALYQSSIIAQQESSDGTLKLLLQWESGGTSECVLIPDATRQTACISTQVGCPVECVFCASGIGGLQRQLTAAEIVEQAMRVRDVCKPERLSNVVFMGLGEPLANYDATVRALRIINAPWGLGIGARKITVSTVGLPTRIVQLSKENLQVTLALSLHAPNDELRKKIIPWAQRVSIVELAQAANTYYKNTGREITLEYILLGGLNDAVAHARELAQVAQTMRSNINLIAYNPVDGLPYVRPEPAVVHRFAETLTAAGVNNHVRRSRGLDIDAACGQLRRQNA